RTTAAGFIDRSSAPFGEGRGAGLSTTCLTRPHAKEKFLWALPWRPAWFRRISIIYQMLNYRKAIAHIS
ncbi:MAG TPA: hypothetical protein VG274_11795, partial [Rhizomicrobium sp.]|nr:hypothetical protein [Rhizomicrobium sp.]